LRIGDCEKRKWKHLEFVSLAIRNAQWEIDLPTLPFAILSFGQGQACGPEARAARAKSIGGKRIVREIPPCFRRMGGPIGRPAGPSYKALTQFWGKERLARPTQKARRALWFLRAPPLPPGLATPRIRFILRLLGEKGRGARSFREFSILDIYGAA
jgi:hypothetical protein